MPGHECAIAFDFDGTLIQNGPLNSDKGVHIIFSTWYACRRTAFRQFLSAGSDDLTGRMVGAYIHYPGSPRFEQFSAIVNALVKGKNVSVPAFEGFGLDASFRAEYEKARQIYNRVYSALNDAAAERFWKPYASVKDFLARMAGHYDLAIVSGVTQDILEEDFKRHRFDSACFTAIHGGNAAGGNDKGQILAALKQQGYRDILFVADSNKDLEYAQSAGVKFYRIRLDADYQRLDAMLPGEFPDERAPWAFEAFELDFFRVKSAHLIENYQDTDDLPFVEMSGFINT